VNTRPTQAHIHPNLEVHRVVGRPSKTRKTYLVDLVSPNVEFLAHNNSIVNLERAVNERVFYVSTKDGFKSPPRPENDLVFARNLRSFENQLKNHLFKTTPISYDSFVSLYRGRRAVIMQQALDTILAGETVTQWDARIRAFVKAEKHNFSAKFDPCPRVIQPRSPRYNIEVGRYLRPIEERLYRAIAKVFNSRTVFKGMNAVEQGRLMKQKWDKFTMPVAIGLDASRFDQHVSPTALRWEHNIYGRCFRDRRPLMKYLHWQIANKGVGYCKDGNIKYKVDGCRMSGDMNTALGNCLLMCAMVYSYLDHCGITKYELANNGDDCTVILESEHHTLFVTHLDQWFTSMGFTMKVENPVFKFERIEFCQTRPVLGPYGYQMVRIPQVAMAKDCISLIPINGRVEYEAWLAAVGMGGLSLTSGMPVWQSFYKSFLRGSAGRAPRVDDQYSGFKMLGEHLEPKESPVSEESRYSFWVAFGITPDQQANIEAYYDNVNLRYCVEDVTNSITKLPNWFQDTTISQAQ
jgi:hypothetical protein